MVLARIIAEVWQWKEEEGNGAGRGKLKYIGVVELT